MVDVMKQFDSNGNQLASPLAVVPSTTTALKMPGANDPANNGVLSSGGV
jgi:hypothetical protein